MVGLMIMALVGSAGIAVDGARSYLVKARIGDALDAAALAGAQEAMSEHFEDDVRMYFEANFPPGFMGAEVTLDPPAFDPVSQVVTLSARAEIGVTFMSLFGFDDVTVATSTQVTRQTAGIDVVLAIDMSGSMDNSDGAGSTRIAAARNAALELVNILYGEETFKENLKIGLVPWSGKVNVFENGTSSTPVPLMTPRPRRWRGCVYARYTDDGDSDNDADHLLGPVTVGGTDWTAWLPVGPEGEPGRRQSCSSCTRCPRQGITRLTDDRGEIENAIGQLRNPDGSTNMPQGLAWAWRAVTPGEPFDDAEPFPKGRHKRAIVLLTDGQNYGYAGDGYNAVFGSGESAGPNGMNDRLRALAENIKDQGVEIYTIQFYYSSGPLADLMKEVATEPKAPYYHFAPHGGALAEAFQEVANNLSELRISR